MRFEINPGKVLRYPAELVAVKEGRFPHVLNVEVDLSESCQLNCASCDFPDHYAAHMSWAMAPKVARLLHGWGTKAVVFTGGGEPTLCPDFAPIVQLFSQRFELGLYTNGVDPVFVDMADRFRWVFVSLDAASPEEWARYKRAPEAWYSRVLANIKESGRRTTTGVGFLISESNYERVEAMAQTGLQAGASYVHFRPLYPCLDSSWRGRAMPILERVASWENVSVAWDKFEDLWHWQRGYKTCWASLFLRLIDAEGNIWACPTTRGKRRLGHVDSFKNLREPLPVTEECRPGCRGHGMNKLLDYIMSSGPHDAFV